MAYIMLQQCADLAAPLWIMCKCYLTLIFQWMAAALSGGLGAQYAALSLKASRENEVRFPETVKTA